MKKTARSGTGAVRRAASSTLRNLVTDERRPNGTDARAGNGDERPSAPDPPEKRDMSDERLFELPRVRGR